MTEIVKHLKMNGKVLDFVVKCPFYKVRRAFENYIKVNRLDSLRLINIKVSRKFQKIIII